MATKSITITRRNRNLSYGSTATPAAIVSQTRRGGAALVARAFDEDCKAWGNAPLSASGVRWNARMFVGGNAIQEPVAEVLDALRDTGSAIVTVRE